MQHIKLSQSSSFMTLGAWDTAWMLSKFWPMTKGSSLHYSALGQLQQQFRDCACIVQVAASGLMAHSLVPDQPYFEVNLDKWQYLMAMQTLPSHWNRAQGWSVQNPSSCLQFASVQGLVGRLGLCNAATVTGISFWFCNFCSFPLCAWLAIARPDE